MSGITAIKRKSFRGGGMDASTSSFDKGATSKGPNPSRPDKKDYGATDFQVANQGFTATGPGRYTGGDDPTPSRKDRDTQKFKYDKQFYDIGKIGPSHSRKSLLQRNKIKNVLNYINYQKKQNKAKLDAGVFNVLDDYEGTFNDLSYADRVALARSSALSFQDPNLALAGGKKGYSQKTINDILSGKRQNIDFYSKLDVANAPTFLGKGAAIGANFLGKTFSGPVTKEKLDELFDKGVELDKLDPTKETTFDLMKQYEPDRYEKFFGGGGGDGGGAQPYLPIDYNPGDENVEDVVEDTNDFTYRFGDNQNVIYENYGTPGYRTTAADGGIMGTRARRAMGGIMNRVDQRQQFFLGGIGKTIGKAFKGVAKAAGKVLKSDVGKMALLAAGAYYTGGGSIMGYQTAAGRAAGGFGKTAFMSNLGKIGTYVKENPFKSISIASTVLPFLAGGAKPNEDIGMAERGGKMKDSKGNEAEGPQIRAEIDDAYESGDPERIAAIEKYYAFLPPTEEYMPFKKYGKAGRTTVATGGRIGRAEGGLMDLGGMEKDYRAEGGFVPIGEYEKKDDVPARLSVNEFVFTADAVRGAGQGDIDKGAEIMENMMENLENGGTVSEESQGNKGAQNMFKTSERLGAVI